MARTAKRKFGIDLRPAIEYLGMKEFMAQVISVFGVERIAANIVKHVSVKDFLASLTPGQRRELKRRLFDEQFSRNAGAARSRSR